jgi:hypothetical protein
LTTVEEVRSSQCLVQDNSTGEYEIVAVCFRIVILSVCLDKQPVGLVFNQASGIQNAQVTFPFSASRTHRDTATYFRAVHLDDVSRQRDIEGLVHENSGLLQIDTGCLKQNALFGPDERDSRLQSLELKNRRVIEAAGIASKVQSVIEYDGEIARHVPIVLKNLSVSQSNRPATDISSFKYGWSGERILTSSSAPIGLSGAERRSRIKKKRPKSRFFNLRMLRVVLLCCYFSSFASPPPFRLAFRFQTRNYS